MSINHTIFFIPLLREIPSLDTGVVLDLVIKTIQCVSVCVEDCGLHCHLSGTQNIRKHLKLYLHLAEILGGRSFLMIVSFQHSTNSDWVGVLVSIYSTV